jgi:hypothetical protein
VTDDYRPCPDGASLTIKGEHFPCDQMRHMHPDCTDHTGWGHASTAAEAVWGPMPTDAAYQRGYQDGRRDLAEHLHRLGTALRTRGEF